MFAYYITTANYLYSVTKTEFLKWIEHLNLLKFLWLGGVPKVPQLETTYFVYRKCFPKPDNLNLGNRNNIINKSIIKRDPKQSEFGPLSFKITKLTGDTRFIFSTIGNKSNLIKRQLRFYCSSVS